MPRSRQQIGILAVSVSAIGLAAAWMWIASPNRAVSAPASTARPASPPATRVSPVSPASPVPAGQGGSVARTPLKRMSFEPADGIFVFTAYDLHARLIGSQVKIVEHRGPLASRRQGRVTHASAQSPRLIWSGPVADALFVHEMTEGVNTLRDRKGTILWSDAAKNGSPDLTLERTEEGKARLLDKKGALLWSGTLPPESSRTSSSRRSGKTYEYHSSGIHISGVNGTATVTDDSKCVLWSGTLPPEPVLLFRRGPQFTFMGARGSVSGSSTTTWLRLSVEKGEVTAEDEKRRIGAQPIDLLKVSSENGRDADPRRSSLMAHTPRFILPEPSLRHKTAVFYTFTDSHGSVVGRREDLSAPPAGAREYRLWRPETQSLTVRQGHRP